MQAGRLAAGKSGNGPAGDVVDVDSNWSSLDQDGNGRVSGQEFASAYGTVTPRQDRN